jgi:hypothetical protein
MSALTLTLFVSGGVVVLAIIAFFAAVVRRDHEHADRLAMLPLDDDAASAGPLVHTPSK